VTGPRAPKGDKRMKCANCGIVYDPTQSELPPCGSEDGPTGPKGLDREQRKFMRCVLEAPPVKKAACLDCGKPYSKFPLDVILPRSQWLEIHPADGGLLCAGCIVKRASKVPGCTVVHAILEIAPHPKR